MVASGNPAPLIPNFSNYQPLPQYQPLTWQGNTEESFDLRQLLTVARRRRWLILGTSLLVGSGVAVRNLDREQVYAGKFRLLVEPVTTDPTTNIVAENQPLSASRLDYATQIQVLWSNQVLSPISEAIKQKYPEINYNSLAQNLKISQVNNTKILEISYQNSDPEKIKFVLEQVAEGYIAYSWQKQQGSLQQGLEFVNVQLPKLQEEVNQLQAELQKFRQENNFIEPSAQAQTLSSTLNNLAVAKEENQTQLAEMESLATNLQAQLELDLDQAVTISALSAAPRYQELLDRLQQIEQQIALESARFTEISPLIQKLQEQKQNLLPLLAAEARAVLGSDNVDSEVQFLAASPNPLRLQLTQSLVETNNKILLLKVREENLAKTELELRNSLDKLAELDRKHTDLQRNLKLKAENLQRFLLLRENLRIQQAQEALPWQLLDEVKSPQKNVSPSKSRSLLIAAIAGLLAGGGAALVAEKLDRVFHSPEELHKTTNLPILGTIPFQKKIEESPGTSEKNSSRGRYQVSAFSEAFRSLNTNIQFLSSDAKIHSLVVSSSVPMEGKSTISFNLAQAAAAMGQKVLLVDADLRRPQVHIMAEISNVWGLSQVIAQDISAQDVIQQTAWEDNFYILTAGKIPPDPTRLLAARKMQKLIQYWQEKFDLVIFDTPPLLGLVDARLLAKYTDGIVMVVGLDRTDKSVFKEVWSGLQMSQSNLLGVVANGIKGYTPTSVQTYSDYYPAIASPT
ncbi:GumC family protein [Oscillatoria salina]|uniref:GumC family protein n=1 Tax=Oscillatoria salina TaxID=331517 RepID=UPI0013B98DC4|nr:polysaccharide biosynthesis tyrosine autokinase [Oscillatoria salina]MBZ8180826.1 polysaccharide biosynthesis tyrosine autokinase [Oscillatoria salina IIICB1]NET90111.1 polysaccharide biosynthesis tyrosine autokinase [Kamptonema sp. SIO1D9]